MSTVGKYLKVNNKALCHNFERTCRDTSFMFCGDGKVVEVEEAFI